MFLFASGLLGVIGIFYVRRRFARKRDHATGGAA